MYLQLADNAAAQAAQAAIPQQQFYNMMGQGPNPMEGYLWVPAGLLPGFDDVWVNEKEFDDLNELEWHTLMSMLEPHQPTGLGLWPFSTKKGRQRRKQRRDERQTRKLQRITTRGEAGTGIGGAIKNIAQMFTPGASGPEMQPSPTMMPAPQSMPFYQPPAPKPEIPKGYKIDPTTGELVELKWYEKWQNWALIGGGVLLLGGGAVAVTRARRRRR